MKLSDAGRLAIEQREGVVLKVYRDSAGYLTAGMGHKLPESTTLKPGIIDSTTLKPGDPITQAQCDDWARTDIETAEAAVNRLVAVPLNQNQFDALCSFVFNVGPEAFGNSTLLKLLNAGNYTGAQAEFARWHYTTRNGQKVPDEGLLNRRIAEAAQFGTPVSGVIAPIPAPAAPAPPPTRVTQTTTGRLQVGALLSGGIAAVVQGVNQAQPILSGISNANGIVTGMPEWLRVVSGVLVLGCIGACAATLIHKQRSL